MDWVEIGSRIKKQQEAFGYTREAFAEQLEITPKFCADIELGKKGMSVPMLCRIASVLKLSTDYVLFGEDQQKHSFSSVLRHCSPMEQKYAEDILKTFLIAMESKENQV